MRNALEASSVRENLNNWIDLIFGSKQRGEPAKESVNTFFFITYENSIDLNTLDDQIMRLSLES